MSANVAQHNGARPSAGTMLIINTLEWIITPPIKCGMKSLIHCQTSTVLPWKFGNGYMISSHTLRGLWSLIDNGIKIDPCECHLNCRHDLTKYCDMITSHFRHGTSGRLRKTKITWSWLPKRCRIFAGILNNLRYRSKYLTSLRQTWCIFRLVFGSQPTVTAT